MKISEFGISNFITSASNVRRPGIMQMTYFGKEYQGNTKHSKSFIMRVIAAKFRKKRPVQ